jgi:hypothetical protein
MKILLKAALGVALVIVAVVSVTLWRTFAPEVRTYGRISISSPEVFTRERLVNDRYEQDAWLKTELGKDISCRPTTTDVQKRHKTAKSTLQLPKVPAQQKTHSKDSPQTTSQQVAEAKDPQNADLSAGDVSASNLDCLEAAMDYRDQLRSLRIENQLDDRHDLNGASLFRLKFDIAVVPGKSTTAIARVEVKVGPVDGSFHPVSKRAARASQENRIASCNQASSPGGGNANAANLEAWKAIYFDWIDSVDRRLNQTQHEELSRYTNNSLSRSEYLTLIHYLGNRYDMSSPEKLPSCAAVLSKRDAGSKTFPTRPDDQTLPLSAHDHNALRTCMLDIVGRTMAPFSFAGQYNDSDGQNGSIRKSAGPRFLSREELVKRAAATQLSQDLDGYYASKSIRLVLGIEAPPLGSTVPASLGGLRDYSTDLFQGFGQLGEGTSKGSPIYRLLKLSYFHHYGITDLREPNQDSFDVRPNIARVVAIDRSVMTREKFPQKPSTPPTISGYEVRTPLNSILFAYRYDDFSIPKDIMVGGLRKSVYLSKLDMGGINVGLGTSAEEQHDNPFTGNEFVESDEAGVYVAEVQTGLYTFTQALRDHGNAFAYAVTPQEHGVLIHSKQTGEEQLSTSMGVSGNSGAAAADVQSQRTANSEQFKSRAGIIGFGENVSSNDGSENCSGEASFGWIINPEDIDSRTGSTAFHQELKKYTVSAEVSVPSWWRSVLISTATSWIAENGRDVQQTTHVDQIEIPSDFEAFEETLLGSQGPELDDSALDAIQLRVQDDPDPSQFIVIPGRRLWRSTQVTLGYHQASSIAVLPNMKGIIAKFDSIPDMSTPDEKSAWCDRYRGASDLEIERPVRVWTSQGSVTLPRPATIYALGKCKESRPHGEKS